ncbi:DNA-3-methyladenine glycosylase I [Fructobacillus sp. M2-14]|uniref:DNA-3-methyladenine glycosylase I n=1 Tax=Fructobacillus broussonetiae TaxID=2713173 RepID=A0ABS5R0J7_9LACO|nr:DNA-3-methyladenine glycosylase I [Fructobacillus broussonetiae]MBS9338965.1 DNA-3-methyladenine glycosylase I [Fructobacillus broussonetiae]
MPKRCLWVESEKATDILLRYHDDEYSRIVRDERLTFEWLSLELFQSGLNWRVVLSKRAALQRAFAYFNVDQIATFTEDDVKRLLEDPNIIRNRSKIEAVIQNAKEIADWHERGLTLNGYCWDEAEGERQDVGAQPGEKLAPTTPLSQKISRELKASGFSFTGPVVIESFLQAIGIHNGHNQDCDWHDVL